jgi:DNA-binding response OmpR family regulator
MRARLLIVEDNRDLAFGLQTSLEVEGYEVMLAADGRRGLEAIRATPPDLVVLDLMLPELSGYEVLRTIRSENHTMPVLILTAKGEEVNKVQGFRLGADDYVVKPVGVLEFIARVEALLRRSSRVQAVDRTLLMSDLSVDLGRRTVFIGTRPVDLSPMEFDLLAALARREGALATRGELLKEVWGYRSRVESRTVDTHIAKLRSKIEGAKVRIVTVRKRGYRLE